MLLAVVFNTHAVRYGLVQEYNHTDNQLATIRLYPIIGLYQALIDEISIQ